MNGTVKHSTGFFYNFETSNGKTVRAILTCKHSIEDFAKIDLITCLDNGRAEPIDNVRFTMTYAADSPLIVKHHDKTIDLAALIFSYDDKIFLSGNQQPFYLSLDNSLIPTEEQLNQLSYIEEVLMVGYPQNIWDTYNNKPIIRKGITSSPIQLDFGGKKQFLLDIASFHGSSGSPVFIYKPSPHLESNALVFNQQVYLLGMFFGGWEEVTNGSTPVTAYDKEQDKKYDLELVLPNHLGIVLKSAVFMELKDLIEKCIEEEVVKRK